MKTGMRYIVTKASDDGTFRAGDHISLNEDGTISCIEAQGWIEKDDVQIAMDGVEYELDRIWAQQKLEEAQMIAKEYG